MSEHVYKKIELIGSSPNSIDEAIEGAISRASKTTGISTGRSGPGPRPDREWQGRALPGGDEGGLPHRRLKRRAAPRAGFDVPP